MAAYTRILLKLSGEALAGKLGYGLDQEAVDSVCGQLGEVHALGVTVAVVVGGGNIFRGLSAPARGMDRVSADHMGMLATVINGIALRETLERKGIPARLMSAFPIADIAEPFIRRRAVRHLEKGRIVIFSGGTGNPYFSTDTAASLRAVQVGAEVILKGTKVDGVYDGDPATSQNYKKFDFISFDEVLRLGLRVMDATAITMCREYRIPIVVFNLTVEGNLLRVVNGEPVGTIVTGSPKCSMNTLGCPKEDDNG